jgi:diaminopimelate decarboxylase
MTLLDILPSLRLGARPRLDPAIWPITTRTDDLGRLCVGGIALTEIADEFGTPAYVLDEDDLRGRARRYHKAAPDIEVVYAASALLTIAVARWVVDEGLGIEVCSAGELATALAGGINPARIVLAGNAKTRDDLRDAVAAGVGRIVVSSAVEIAYLNGLVRRRQRVLMRVSPDVDIHGQTEHAVRQIVAAPLLELVGLHCDELGPQVGDTEALRRLIAAMADIRSHHHVILTELHLGGHRPDLDGLASTIDDALDSACASERFPRPRLLIELGRPISARAAVTLYRVCAVEPRPDGQAFVMVDGPVREALRETTATITLANRHSLGPSRPSTLVGRTGEGDHTVELPADVHPGDLLAAACTGSALVTGPPLVSVRKGSARVLIRRETTADLLARDRG